MNYIDFRSPTLFESLEVIANLPRLKPTAFLKHDGSPFYLLYSTVKEICVFQSLN